MSRVCIFVKDPEIEFKSILNKLDVPCVAEVIGFDRLTKEFRQFKDKRQLLRDYDLFLADIRIYKMLPEKLGKEFYTKKAFPCPIKIHGIDDVQDRINKACGSTYFMLGNGPNYSLKVGKYS
jgi:ribosome biogenesis protein UTP30